MFRTDSSLDKTSLSLELAQGGINVLGFRKKSDTGVHFLWNGNLYITLDSINPLRELLDAIYTQYVIFLHYSIDNHVHFAYAYTSSA